MEVCDSASAHGNSELEAKLNLMHTTYLILASQVGCPSSVMESAKQFFLNLYNSYFDVDEKVYYSNNTSQVIILDNIL